ncbi:membrane-associated guanylate kinase, WW and PDZ domain-containing protein 2 [Euwallacea similis]|uniref:membrane-associated guanylate kinase, WW and PDZ domain-containing protein 2 n=1 Tax=Euwallacea similis TaxID=1736056 RepID=UPI00345024F2
MSHSSDPNPLSQPLRVETEDPSVSETTNYYGEEKDSFNHGNEGHENDSLGPLPPKWEKAFTESGEAYFIDHTTGTSHWLDPRLSKFQKKSLEDCLDDELPYGWEKISDPHYGTYFIDHVNRRTQYENPVIQAKRAASQASARASRTYFTRDPSELCGQRIRTSLVKSSRGLGFTIVGGDDGVDEFLQIKSVVPKGPAWLDGQLQMGDVIVFVNDTCVLGYTHNQIVRLFQSISVGSTVQLEVCRGYPLPFDPNDPNTEVVTTIAVDAHLQSLSNDKRLLDTNYNFLEGEDCISRDEEQIDAPDDIDDLLKGINTMTLGKLEVRVRIVKGNLGFGFTIADSACGQRVKKILDRQRCKNLMEGDILLEINDISLQSLSHDEVVQVLKNCPYNNEATICVQRGCSNKTTNIRNKHRKLEPKYGSKDIVNAHRSKTPTADLYSTQPREVLPSRPKTPLVDTRNLSKTSLKDINSNSNEAHREFQNDVFPIDKAQLPSSIIDSHEEDELDVDIPENNQIKPSYEYPPPVDLKFSPYMPPHRYDCACAFCSSPRPNALDSNNIDYPNNRKKVNNYWPYQINTRHDYITMHVVLNRLENGFGFRIVGGIEDKSQVAVGQIVPGGAADLDGRMQTGDEIVSVEGFSVLKAEHRQVVQLINAAAARGQVSLILRRRVFTPPGPGPVNYTSISWSLENTSPALPANHAPPLVLASPTGPTYDVTVQRTESEGFGFVIISSVNKIGSTIGRLIEDSPAERCGRLRVGDYIVAVNHIDIMHLSHGDIVNLIKESGLSVTLTIAPNADL